MWYEQSIENIAEKCDVFFIVGTTGIVYPAASIIYLAKNNGAYLIEVNNVYVGSIYLTRQREIGIGIFKDRRKKGYAMESIKMLMNKHPGRFLANINPENDPSIKLFEGIGFKHIQNTYEL